MSKRLTTFSKFLIVAAVVGGAFLGIRYLQGSGILGGGASGDKPAAKNEGRNTSGFKSSDVVKVGVVTWGGYAGGQYFNEGFEASRESRFTQEYGMPVEFQVLDDFEASRNAFRADEVNLLWSTVDAFPTEVNGLADFDPVIVFQADWSRGGDAIVVRRGITKVSDLKGKKIAVAEMTPSHSFLLWLLDAGGISVRDVEIVPQASAVDAAEVFKSQKVDAAVVWSPDDILCTKAVPGSRILESTRSATNIIADVFIAKRAWAEKNRDKLQKLYEGWMRGAAEINSSAGARRKAAEILAREFTDRGTALTTEEAAQMIDNVRLTTHGDNRNFFGLNNEYKGVNGNTLYSRMADVYSGLGYVEGGPVPIWRRVAFPALVTATQLDGQEHAAEGQKQFTKVTAEEGKEREAFASKQVSISFRTGEFQLDENAKYIIDKEFVEIAKAFASARIRIEGNTDNVGSRESNIKLSQQRAQSVANYLAREHGMSANRFIVVGNGPDKPVASNNTDEGRAKNRRTDFELVRD